MDRRQSPKGVVVFDLDGTLSDTSGDITFSANFIRRHVGKPELTKAQVMALVGRGAPYLLTGLTGLPERDTGQFATLLKTYQEHYLRHQTQHSKLYPGVRDLLTYLKRDGFHMYILSNKPHPATVGEVRGLDIASFFQDVWGAGLLPAMKPDPVGIHRAMENSGVQRNQTWMVGDMAPDIEVANNAGIKSIYVTWGFGPKEPANLNPTHVAEDPTELQEIIDRSE